MSVMEMTVNEIVDRVIELSKAQEWILLTGGEPLEQDVTPLVSMLRARGYKIALETSGTQPIPCDFDWICVSPKGKWIKAVLEEANELKYVVGGKEDIPKDLGIYGPIISLQPMSLSKEATELCIKVVEENVGWRLSIQLHKYLNLP